MNHVEGWRLALLLAAGAVLAGVAHADVARAGSLQEDEARIEALLNAERAAQAKRALVGTAESGVADPATPVIAEVTAAVPAPSENDAWLVPAIEQNGLPFAELRHYVGRRVDIVTTGDRAHRGTVKSADARQVTLLVRRPGGNATYTLRRDQVKRVDPR
jgi:hypothetical protein